MTHAFSRFRMLDLSRQLPGRPQVRHRERVIEHRQGTSRRTLGVSTAGVADLRTRRFAQDQ